MDARDAKDVEKLPLTKDAIATEHIIRAIVIPTELMNVS